MAYFADIIKEHGAVVGNLVAITAGNGAAWYLARTFGPPSLPVEWCTAASALLMTLAWIVTAFFFRKYHSSQRTRCAWMIAAVLGCLVLGGWYARWFVDYTYIDAHGQRHVKGCEYSNKLKIAMNDPKVEVQPGVVDFQDHLRPEMTEHEIRKIIGDNEYDLYDFRSVDRMKLALLYLWLGTEGMFAFAIGIAIAAVSQSQVPRFV